MPISWNKYLEWNTVDARGADGLLWYGRVIDCAEEGLVIDFGGGKAPQLIPLGQIYRCKLERFKSEFHGSTENLPVDALLSLRRDEPAKWYPGVLLTGDFNLFDHFGFVRITTPDGTSAVLVPGARIRARRSAGELGQLLLEKGQFIKEEIQLPVGVSSGTPSPGSYETAPADQRLLYRFNTNCSEHWMVATHIDGCVLHVLKITDRFRRKFDRDSRKSCPKLQGDTFRRMLGIAPQAQRKRPNEEQDTMTKRMSSSVFSTPTTASTTAAATTVISPAITSASSSPACQSTSSATAPSLQPPATAAVVKVIPCASFTEVPRDVLADILGCLDGLQQTKLRRVCSTWNALLTALPLSRVFRVPEDSGIFGSGHMGPRVCLLNRWTAQTTVIVYSSVITTGSIFDADMDRFPESQHYGKKLPRLDKLLLGDLAWEWRGTYVQQSFSHFVGHICSELGFFASVCHSLVLMKVTVVLGGNKTPVVVRFANVRTEGKLSADTLWDLMDKSLPALNNEDLACWAEWMRDNSDNELPGRLVQILHERQSSDPRDNNPFRGNKWTRGDLAKLDLEKLNRITSRSLVKTCCYEKLVLVLHW